MTDEKGTVLTLRVRMDDERLTWHIDNWRIWQNSGGGVTRGLPSRSPIIGASGYREFDAMVAEADARCAHAVDSIVWGLPPRQRTAMIHVELGAVFRIRNVHGEWSREDPRVIADLYWKAREEVRAGLSRKGIP